ncbi:neutral/alkaline non-lysosomal ceramidase N-terminal domain-containing protein, partial [candidate division KSB1 bacterium]
MNRRWFVLLAVMILVLAGSPGEIYSSPANLKGGTASIDITPPVGGWLSGYAVRDKPSEGIADRLFAKAVCLSDGTTEIAIVSTDLVGVTTSVVASVRRLVENKIGIPGANIMIAATHTHFGPVVKEYKFDKPPDPDYLVTLMEKLARVITDAHGKLTEVRIGTATGAAGELAYNRRSGRTEDP